MITNLSIQLKNDNDNITIYSLNNYELQIEPIVSEVHVKHDSDIEDNYFLSEENLEYKY